MQTSLTIDDVAHSKQSLCHRIGAGVAVTRIMVHKILCLTFTMMSVVMIAIGQNRYHDERALHERAKQLESFIVAAATRHNVDARILRAICFIESRYRINIISPKGAHGPMQFMPDTAARYGLRDPHNPEQAIDAAARYFRDLLKRFDGRTDLALAAYNAGEGAVTSFMTGKPLVLSNGRIVNVRGVVTGGIPPYLETQRYVRLALALVNDSVNGHVEKSSRRLPLDTGRGPAIDALDLSGRAQKLSRTHSSSFIEVQ